MLVATIATPVTAVSLATAATLPVAPAVAALWSRFASTKATEAAALRVMCDEDEKRMKARPSIPDALRVPADIAEEGGVFFDHHSAMFPGGPYRWMSARGARHILNGGTAPRVIPLADGGLVTLGPPSARVRAFALAHKAQAEAYEASYAEWEGSTSAAHAEADETQVWAVAERAAIEEEAAALPLDTPGLLYLLAAFRAFSESTDCCEAPAHVALKAGLLALLGWDVDDATLDA